MKYMIFLAALVLSGCLQHDLSSYQNDALGGSYESGFDAAHAEPDVPLVCIDDDCFRVEIADTEAEQSKGLMWRTSLAGDEGMLFVFESRKRHAFWMRNTVLPLDIIWIDNSTVVDIVVNAQPCDRNCDVYVPDDKADHVLEINGMESLKREIRVGSNVTFFGVFG